MAFQPQNQMPKKTKKSQKKPKKTQKTVSNFECWPKLKPKKTKKNQKNPKKTKKKPVSNFEFWPKPIPKKTKKNQKNQKKTNANLEILKNQKKPKKTKKSQCQFADFGVATGFFCFFLGEHPPFLHEKAVLRSNTAFLLNKAFARTTRYLLHENAVSQP